MSYDIAGGGAVPAALGGGLRRIVDDQLVAHGGWCMIPSAFAAEVVSASGCEWLCVDLQHGLIGNEGMRTMVMAAAIRRTPVLVRVPWNEPAAIMCALDAGADGLIIPMVNSAEDAERAVAAARYPPRGYRSWGPVRSVMAQPGFNPRVGNAQTVCLVMIETVEAVENLDAILNIVGVDGVYVGPQDLAISHAGTNEHAGVAAGDVEMIERISERCRAAGCVAGIGCTDGADARRWQQAGYTMLGLTSDAALIGQGMAEQLAIARAARE